MQPVSESAAVDLRLYRLAWLPALLAVVILMFSLEGAPSAIESATPPGAFEPDRAARLARQIEAQAPDREPGSDGDELVADLVAEQFKLVAAGATTEQRFDAETEAGEASVRNVLLTLPGDTDTTLVVLAPRDAQHAPAAASSAAATGLLVELAHALGVSGHEKTIVFASTSGGAAGATELLDQLPERGTVEAVVTVSQPGAAAPRAPFVVATSSGEQSGPAQLQRTAELAVETQVGRGAGDESAATQLARLAIPSGLGPQAPLIADGFDAVAISSAGERPLAAADDGPDDLSQESVDAFGRAVQSTLGAVDGQTEPLDRGPRTYLELGDNLVPGWTLALLALTLLLPAGVAAVDGCARAARRRQHARGGLAWAAARGLPFVAALAIVYLLALAGLVPRPPFPFDPGLYDVGGRAAAAFAVAVLALAATAVLLRRLGITALRAPDSAAPALGAVAVAATLLIWLSNPYLALLVVPAAHVWLLAGRGGAGGKVALVAATVLACVPTVLAFVVVASALDLGKDAPWTFTLMIADGQLDFAACVGACFLAGALLGNVALGFSRRALPGNA